MRPQTGLCDGRALFRILQSLDVSLESRAVLTAGFEVGLQLFDEHFEPPYFVAQFLTFSERRRSRPSRRRK